MPLIRRLPKRGFNNAAFKAVFALVNIGDLKKLMRGHASPSALREKGSSVADRDGVKILARGRIDEGFDRRSNKLARLRVKDEQAGDGGCRW